MPRKPRTARTKTRRHAPSSRPSAAPAPKPGDPRPDRLDALRARLAEMGRDAALITNPHDIRYLSGFHGEDSFFLIAGDDALLISDFRFEEDVDVVRPVADVHFRSTAIAKETGELIKKRGLGAVALQKEHVTLAQRDAIAKHAGARTLHPESGLLGKLRLIKSDGELKLIRRAIKIQQDALEAFLDQIEIGMSELEAAALLEYELKTRGSEEPAFGPIVAAKANGSKPHAVPGKTKLANNQPLLIDWGATYEGYRSDMTRCFALGGWPKKLREIYPIVEEAFHAGVAAVKPGVTGREVDAAARQIIDDAGFGARFGHSLGHGIGLDVHEGPRLSKTSDDVLEAGMVVTVEPGIYFPGVGGVRIENDVLVTERGRKDLCSLPTDIDWATR